MRNLAHEIKNPLGGMRGAAQLLERELDRARACANTPRSSSRRPTGCRSLMDRLLTPHRTPQLGAVNIHEVLERVRSLMLAEFPERDASSATTTSACRTFTWRSRAADPGRAERRAQRRAGHARRAGRRSTRSATRVRAPGDARQAPHRLALELQVDRQRAGHPGGDPRADFLSAGVRPGRRQRARADARADAIAQHHGVIECDSQPGHTVFSILLPLPS